jgi:hypothetical protein
MLDSLIHEGIWSYHVFKYENQNLHVEVYMDGTMEIIRNYILNEDLKRNIKDNGIIDFF